MNFVHSFEKTAISRSTYIRARKNALARAAQKEMSYISSPKGIVEFERYNAPYNVSRPLAAAVAMRKAHLDIYRRTKRNPRKILNTAVDAGNPGKLLRQKEHARWQLLSNKINRKLNQKDLGIAEMGADLPPRWRIKKK